jgi:hypothetical protein
MTANSRKASLAGCCAWPEGSAAAVSEVAVVLAVLGVRQ